MRRIAAIKLQTYRNYYYYCHYSLFFFFTDRTRRPIEILRSVRPKLKLPFFYDSPTTVHIYRRLKRSGNPVPSRIPRSDNISNRYLPISERSDCWRFFIFISEFGQRSSHRKHVSRTIRTTSAQDKSNTHYKREIHRIPRYGFLFCRFQKQKYNIYYTF